MNISAAIQAIESVVIDGDMRPEYRDRAGEGIEVLRAEIERLREAIAQIALTNTNGILSRPDKNDRITTIINKALEA